MVPFNQFVIPATVGEKFRFPPGRVLNRCAPITALSTVSQAIFNFGSPSKDTQPFTYSIVIQKIGVMQFFSKMHPSW